jgi:hypothetical protein
MYYDQKNGFFVFGFFFNKWKNSLQKGKNIKNESFDD